MAPRSGRKTANGENYHDPTAGMGGAPPARSALSLRFGLALFGLIVCGLGAAGWAAAGAPYALVALLAALAFIALIDIGVIVRRKRRARKPPPT